MSGGDSRGGRGPRGRGPDDRAEELDLDGYEADRPRPGENTRGPALLDLKTRWQTLTARQQLRLRQLGVAGAIGVLGLGLYTASGDKTEQAAPSPSSARKRRRRVISTASSPASGAPPGVCPNPMQAPTSVEC